MKTRKSEQFVQIERRSKLSRAEFNEVMSNLENRIWKNLKTEPLPFRPRKLMPTTAAPLTPRANRGANPRVRSLLSL